MSMILWTVVIHSLLICNICDSYLLSIETAFIWTVLSCEKDACGKKMSTRLWSPDVLCLDKHSQKVQPTAPLQCNSKNNGLLSNIDWSSSRSIVNTEYQSWFELPSPQEAWSNVQIRIRRCVGILLCLLSENGSGELYRCLGKWWIVILVHWKKQLVGL